MLHVVRSSHARTASAVAVVAATACALLGSPAGADVTKRPLKPTLPAAEQHDERADALRRRTAAASATDGEARLVSFATRDMDIKKLDAAAFGDGEDVVR